ncbi:hypothetical protein NX862_14395 [Rhodobacter sp. KR11]|uniref:hypothetical protein n=1 Tax=Rhodobacter sp. KR11 TaxID=2974588 RepID=UPI0022215784|nr:hypothetical protein [Rhodobacter sp. KR11]MCW1919947.1 hypothetical protein [Rhodobacter sp. KR11]
MTKPQTVLEMVRHDAQDLHRKISANLAKAASASWADVEAVQADAAALSAKMKTLAKDQAQAVQDGLKAAIARLEASAKVVKTKVGATSAEIHHANTAMLEGAHEAALGLSQAVAAARSKLAHAIEPKAEPKPEPKSGTSKVPA